MMSVSCSRSFRNSVHNLRSLGWIGREIEANTFPDIIDSVDRFQKTKRSDSTVIGDRTNTFL